MNKVLDALRAFVRFYMKIIARLLNTATRGRLSPSAITIIGAAAHIPIALAIAGGRLTLAAVLLIIFGLFDALDGETARLQNRESSRGMLLDATTDRMKEVFLYTGVCYYFIASEVPYLTPWVVLALGGSILVSYVKAKGEAAVASSGLSAAKVNRLFQDGLIRFEVRMGLLVAGLLFDRVGIAVVIIALGAWMTALDRLIKISQKLGDRK